MFSKKVGRQRQRLLHLRMRDVLAGASTGHPKSEKLQQFENVGLLVTFPSPTSKEKVQAGFVAAQTPCNTKDTLSVNYDKRGEKTYERDVDFVSSLENSS